MGNCQAVPLHAVAHGGADPLDKPSHNSVGAKALESSLTELPQDLSNKKQDPFLVGSAAVPAKATTFNLREENLQNGSQNSHSGAFTCTQTASTYSTHTSTQSNGSEAVDYKSLYQASLSRCRDLEDQNAELSRQHVEISTAKELYLNIFEHFPALIWRSRLDKQCDYFNQTWLNWTGRTVEQEFGFGWAEGVHKDDFDRCVKIYVEAFDKREAFYMEYRLKDRHGEYRWIGDHGTPFNDLDGSFLGYIGSCYDITDQRDNEAKLKRLNATKDKFFGILAHDLRNPIAAFVSMSELLKDGGAQDFTPEEMTEIADQMHQDSTNTLGLLEHLLEWSRAQSDEIAFCPQTIRVATLFEDVVNHVGMSAKAKDITIETHIAKNDDDTGLTISADKNMLITVLRNLLMNAIKFTNTGGTIQLQAKWENDGKSSVLLTVADNGVGMTQDQLDSLFQLSAAGRVQREGTNHEKGTGLGLMICKDFVETKHKGLIWAESTPASVGTQFKVRLPQRVSI